MNEFSIEFCKMGKNWGSTQELEIETGSLVRSDHREKKKARDTKSSMKSCRL